MVLGGNFVNTAFLVRTTQSRVALIYVSEIIGDQCKVSQKDPLLHLCKSINDTSRASSTGTTAPFVQDPEFLLDPYIQPIRSNLCFDLKELCIE